MNPRSTLCLTLGYATFAGFAHAGEIAAQEPADNPGTWCEKIGDWAKVYTNPENPFVQSIKFDGRMHYQWGHAHFNRRFLPDFHGEGSELRRLRLGTKIDFLNKWHFRGIVNLEDGGFRDDVVDFNSIDETYLQYHFGDVGAFENLKLSYGRHKYDIGIEVHQSSNTIRTVERTNISNSLYKGGRPTGLMAFGTFRSVDFTVGFLSADKDDILGSWRGETAYYLSLEKDALGGRFVGDFLWNDGSNSSDDVWGYQWAASLGYQAEFGKWNFIADALAGEGFNRDQAFGFYVIPSTFLIEDSLELVFRYELAEGEGRMLRPNSRNSRNIAPDGAFGDVDKVQSIYAGLNYYFCDKHAKLMVGVTYEEFDGPVIDVDGTTFWTAFRFYF